LRPPEKEEDEIVASFLLGLLAEWFMTILQIEGIMIYC
jgi:hypothetical protein